MIAVPSTVAELQWCHQFFAQHDMSVTADAHWLIWSTQGMPQWVIAYDDWMGTTCQLYMASLHTSPPPRSLIKAVFQHGFCLLKRTHIFAFVNSNNTSAMRVDLWLGFREVYRAAGAHEGGGDLVVFEMTPADCRWLEKAHG